MPLWQRFLQEEIYEVCKYLIGPHPVDGIWLGAADDIIMRERGIEFVDGTAPGFAPIVGCAPDAEPQQSRLPENFSKRIFMYLCNPTTLGYRLPSS